MGAVSEALSHRGRDRREKKRCTKQETKPGKREKLEQKPKKFRRKQGAPGRSPENPGKKKPARKRRRRVGVPIHIREGGPRATQRKRPRALEKKKGADLKKNAGSIKGQHTAPKGVIFRSNALESGPKSSVGGDRLSTFAPSGERPRLVRTRRFWDDYRGHEAGNYLHGTKQGGTPKVRFRARPK